MTAHERRGPKKNLKFIPGEYEDVVFVTTDGRAMRVLVRIFAPILRAWLLLRRLVRRLSSAATRPPDGH